MDPFSALANGIAIFEGLKKFYRFANDAKKAPVERLEFQARFDSVHIALQNTMETLVNCLAKVKDRENTLWIKTLKHPHSPLRGLEKLVEKVNKELEAKKGDIEKRTSTPLATFVATFVPYLIMPSWRTVTII
jgi:hypothetical protein